MLELRSAVISFVKVEMKVTFVHLVFLDLMFFVLCHHRLEVVEQTFWKKVMEEVLEERTTAEFLFEYGIENTQANTNGFLRLGLASSFFLILSLRCL